MKKRGVLHSELSRQIALLGHTDRVVVADSGLPLPRTVPLIDLALTPGVTSFAEVLDALLAEIDVQGHVVAAESFTHAPGSAGRWVDERADAMGNRTTVSHEELKSLLPGVAFAVRTGEQTPFANVILECGVPF